MWVDQFRRRGERDERKRGRHGPVIGHLQPGEHPQPRATSRNLTLTGTAAINATGKQPRELDRRKRRQQHHVWRPGVDTVSYETATSGVRVNLGSTSTQSTGGAGNDRLSGFENLTGSAHADTLTGSSGNNVIRGLGRK